MERRSILRIGGALVAGTGALSFLFSERPSKAERARTKPTLKRDPRGLLDLPEGFEYWILDKAFDAMSDGHRVPSRPDGMGCFKGPGTSLVLMRNHELDYNPMLGPFRGAAPKEAYDPRAAGGVTRLLVDAKKRRLISSNLVLAGTARNCAGGVSPWGWISCEETTDPGHGYSFLCRTEASQLEPPRVLSGYGRFRHEAACVDPQTLNAYLTEDQYDGCLYRFVPKHASDPFTGKLQAMRLRGRPGAQLSSDSSVGKVAEVDWVDLEEPNPKGDTLRQEAGQKGACRIARGEGIWFHGNTVYICSTSGGAARRGQVFALEVGQGKKADRLRLVVESKGAAELDMPDNITVASWGDVYMAEDGAGDQFIRGVTPEGRLYDLARNANSAGELAGLCFSPDEGTLFVNLQIEGITLGISGPFAKFGPGRA